MQNGRRSVCPEAIAAQGRPSAGWSSTVNGGMERLVENAATDQGRVSISAAQEIEDRVRQFVIANFLFGDPTTVCGPEESFLETGIIDSTGVLELVGFLEQTYSLKVEDQELVPDNLDSLRKVAAFVQRKLSA